MDNKTITILTIGIILAVITGITFISLLFNVIDTLGETKRQETSEVEAIQPEPTPPVVDAPQVDAHAIIEDELKTAFVNGCADGNSNIELYCICLYNQLTRLYPDFTRNTDRMQRILDEGYNDEELQFMAQCWDML